MQCILPPFTVIPEFLCSPTLPCSTQTYLLPLPLLPCRLALSTLPQALWGLQVRFIVFGVECLDHLCEAAMMQASPLSQAQFCPSFPFHPLKRMALCLYSALCLLYRIDLFPPCSCKHNGSPPLAQCLTFYAQNSQGMRHCLHPGWAFPCTVVLTHSWQKCILYILGRAMQDAD